MSCLHRPGYRIGSKTKPPLQHTPAICGSYKRTHTHASIHTHQSRQSIYTPPFSRLLRHAGAYSRTILTPNPQGLEFSSTYQKLLKLIENWQSSDRKNFAQFF